MKKVYKSAPGTLMGCCLCFIICFGTATGSWAAAGPARLSNTLFQVRDIDVHGTVTSTSNNPLPGVSVAIEGTGRGTTTDEDGRFALSNVPDNAVLVFSFIGYNTQKISIKGKSVINVQMSASQTSLDQVVVVGYGTERKVDLTGAVDQVGSEVFKDKPTSNALRSLEGQIPGMYINMPTGFPTKSYDPVVRGVGSIGAGGRALVLIDGVPGDLARVNPQDIKSVSVVKDASAAAIYGSRGAFGVILVTTKNPSAGKFQVNYSFSYSLNDRTVKPHLLTNGYLWAENFVKSYQNWSNTFPTTINTGLKFSPSYLEELKKHALYPSLPKVGIDPTSGDYVYYGSSDWQKMLYTDYNPSMNHELSISGGTQKVSYYISGRYFRQHGIFRESPDTYNNYDFRAKGSVQVFPWLKVTNNFSLSRRTYFWARSQHNSGVTIVRRINDEFSPLAMLQNPDGSFTKNAAISFESYYVGHNFHTTTWNQFRNTFSFEAKFLKDRLTVHGDGSYIFTPYLYNEQRYPVTYSDKPGHFVQNEPNNNWASETTHRTKYLATNIYADYTQDFGKHHFKALVGYNYENNYYVIRSYTRYNMLNPDLSDPSLLTGDTYSLTGGGNEWTTSGEFYRLNYNYAHRYLVEINGRYDGSSKFPIIQQYGFFPSVSAGWRISEEPFWKVSPKIISNLKIRGSYGTLGNGNVAPYSFLETMTVDKLDRMFQGGTPEITHRPNVIPDGLTWEKVTSANIGLDADFLDGRLSFTFDKFTRYTRGMFTVGLPLPGVFGTTVPKGNYADMKTPGWELSVSWRDQTGGAHPLKYHVRFTLSDNHSIVTKYNNPKGLINTYYKGERLGDIWGFKTDGLYKDLLDIQKYGVDQTKFPATVHDRSTQPGDVKFVDLDSNKVITVGSETLSDHGDLTVIGNSQPRYLFGFTGDAEWRHFSLSFFFQGVGKKDWWPSSDAAYFWGQYNRPYGFETLDIYKNQWSPDNPDAYFPRLVGYAANGTGQNKELNIPDDRYLQNAAYIRLKSLSIGYNLPNSLISKVGLAEASVFLGGQNLWVWSPMFKITRAIDPEGVEAESHSNDYLTPTITTNEGVAYPILRTVTVGVHLTF